jgi:hypothetical protein
MRASIAATVGVFKTLNAELDNVPVPVGRQTRIGTGHGRREGQCRAPMFIVLQIVASILMLVFCVMMIDTMKG